MRLQAAILQCLLFPFALFLALIFWFFEYTVNLRPCNRFPYRHAAPRVSRLPARETFYCSVDPTVAFPCSYMVLSAITIHTGPWHYAFRKRYPKFRANRSLYSCISLFYRKPPDPVFWLPGTGYAIRIKTWHNQLWNFVFRRKPPDKARIKQRLEEQTIRKAVQRLVRNVQLMDSNNQTLSKKIMTAMTAKSARIARDESPREFEIDFDSVPIQVDNGSSGTIWKDRKAFTTYRSLSPAEADQITGGSGVTGLGGAQVRPIGVGTVQFIIEDNDGTKHKFEVDDTLHIPNNPVNLFCPQQWALQRHTQCQDDVAHVDTKGTNLLMEWSDANGKVFQKYVALSPSSNVGMIYSASEFNGFKAFASLFKSFSAGYVTDDEDERTEEVDCVPATESPGVSQSEGDKLRATPLATTFAKAKPHVIPDKKDDDVLLVSDAKLKMEYHERLGHIPFAQLDSMAQQGLLPKKLAKIDSPKCPGCIYGKAHRKPWRTKAQPKSIKRAVRPGQVVSVDQLESPMPGFIPIAKGRPTTKRYVGATVFADHFSGLTYVHLMTSLNTEETIAAKQAFERYAHRHGVKIEHYHCDNGRFADKAFVDAVHAVHQSITFCGVGAHHQNGVAERRIRDITESARTMLLHAAHRWPKTIISNLWPQALKHAVNVRNALPRAGQKASPLSTFSGTTIEPNLKHFHPFGCPVYVLQTPLQGQKMFPKWKERSRVGIYLGRSPNHASTVPLVLNTQTGLVSPQYHVIYDDHFDTVTRDATFESLWQSKAQLQEHSQELLDRTETLSTDSTIHSQNLKEPTKQIPENLRIPWDTSADPVPASEGEIQAQIQESGTESAPSRVDQSPEGDVLTANNQQHDPNSAQQPAPAAPAPAGTQSTSPDRGIPRGMNIAPQGKTRSGRTVKPNTKFSFAAQAAPDQQQKEKANLISYATAFENTFGPSDERVNEIEEMHPLAGLQSYAASKQRDPDTMTLDRALREPDSEQFIEAMEKELLDHTRRGHWEIVPTSQIPRGVKPINMVWSMKRKRDPAGDIIKWKARLCAHGGMQVQGDTYWDTYSPVVSWSTVRLVMILALVLGWEMRSIDFILAFPQADVRSDNIFMRLPRGTKLSKNLNGNTMLRLIKNLYGLKDAGLTWFEHISKGLTDRGWKPSNIDPCLFTKGNVVLVLYVDDAYLTGPNKAEIDEAIESLKRDFSLTDEGDLKDYLGVRIVRHSDGSAELLQPRMIDRCLHTIGIPTREHDANTKVKTHDTPAETRPILHRDPKGPPRKENWNYRAAIGTLNYLQAMSRPEIAYAVHQCARFCNDPKLSHEKAVKRICRYLKGTQDHGLRFKPDPTKGFECYVDADWAGNWNKDYPTDPSCAYSRTGYLVTYAGCPITWGSKMQSLVALSTTEAEVIALSTALRQVISMMELLKELKTRKIQVPFTQSKIRCRTFEDNSACIELAKNPKLRPRTKHLSVRLFHFRQHVLNGDITIEYINTKEQIADLFTKPLAREAFIYLRSKFMGW